MFSFYFLGMLYADLVSLTVQMALIRAPIIGIETSNSKRLKKSFEFQKDGVLMGSQNVGQHLPTAVVDGMPPLAWMGFLSHKIPHFIDLRFLNPQHLHLYLLCSQTLQQREVDRLKAGLFFFSSMNTVQGLISKTRAISRIPLPLSAISMICCLT
nr:hypothetical protein [Nitrosococcus wardiae]